MDEQGHEPVIQPPVPSKTFAITSLVLGLVAIVPGFSICSVLAIIFGAVALDRIKHGTGGGKNMARWGLVLGIIEVSACVIFLIIGFIIAMAKG
jgi:hypothetical protein